MEYAYFCQIQKGRTQEQDSVFLSLYSQEGRVSSFDE